MLDYLLTVQPGFGPLSWLGMLAWLISLGVGAYLYSVWQERNAVRARFVRQFGLGLLILGAVGLVVLALTALQIPVLSWPIWSYLAALATVLFVGWGVWFFATRLPALLAPTTRRGVQPVRGARTYASNGAKAAAPRPPTPPRPTATTGRREARRDKKRKSR